MSEIISTSTCFILSKKYFFNSHIICQPHLKDQIKSADKLKLKMIISFLQVSKDDRSDIESSSDEDDSPPPSQKHHSSTTNGTNKNGTNGYLTGVLYPDEHWLSWYHANGAMLQTLPHLSVCQHMYGCVWESDFRHMVETWASHLSKLLIDLCECCFVIGSLLILLCNLFLFSYIFPSNYTHWQI